MLRSSTSPSGMPPSASADSRGAGAASGVTSKSGRRARRIPGTSWSGGLASAASSSVDPQNGEAGVVSPPGRPACSSGRPSGGTGLSAYGSPSSPADAQNSPATRAALAASHPPASTRMRQKPVDDPRSTSACRSLSRSASTARSGNRSAAPSASRCRRPASAASDRRSAGCSGSAMTIQPNGPLQLPSSPSSSDSVACPVVRPSCLRSFAGASSPSLMPAISRQAGSRPSNSASSPGGRSAARAPPGSESSTSSPVSGLPASASPAATTRTGPPAASRTQPNATAPSATAPSATPA